MEQNPGRSQSSESDSINGDSHPTKRARHDHVDMDAGDSVSGRAMMHASISSLSSSSSSSSSCSFAHAASQHAHSNALHSYKTSISSGSSSVVASSSPSFSPSSSSSYRLHADSQRITVPPTVTTTANAASTMTLVEQRRAFTDSVLHAIKILDGYHAVQTIVDRVLKLFKEDSQRAVDQSLIDLNQCDPQNGQDVLMQLIHFHSYLATYGGWFDETMKQQFDDIVWGKIIKILDCNCDDDKYNDESGDDDSDIHRVRYDVTRRDKVGRTVLHHACMVSMNEVSIVYHLAERLLNLGADPNACDRCGASPLMLVLEALDRDGQHDRQQDQLLSMVKLLLDYGAEINAQSTHRSMTRSCMAVLVSSLRFSVLCVMYAQLPYDMSAIDYSRTAFCRGSQQESLVQFASSCVAHTRDLYAREKLEDIFILLTSEREKQYAAIRQLLHHHTPLRLNSDSDLTDIIFSFIKATDYEA